MQATALNQNTTWRQLPRGEWEPVCDMLRAIIADESYFTLPADASDEDIATYWFGGLDNEVWVLEEGGQILGSYYLRRNHFELGGHVANAGYITAPHAKGRGIGRILGEHSIQRANERGFRGMQFNFVVSTNTVAVNLWKSLGFTIIGTLPKAYHYKHQRYDDAYVMFKSLAVASDER